MPQNAKEDAKQVNWTNPLIWPHIQIAVRKAGGLVWSPAAICRAAKRSAPEIFDRLTPQIVGTWIDREAKAKGINKWKDSVLERAEKGAAPGGGVHPCGNSGTSRSLIPDVLINIRSGFVSRAHSKVISPLGGAALGRHCSHPCHHPRHNGGLD